MRGSKTRKREWGCLRPWAVVCWLLLWQGAAFLLARRGSGGILPSPWSVARCLARLAAGGAFWRALGWSVLNTALGTALSALAAALLALCAARYVRGEQLLSPPLAAGRVMPAAGLALLAAVWLPGRCVTFAAAFLTALPAVYGGILDGVHRTDRELLEMAQVFHVPPARQAARLYLPRVLPRFWAGCADGFAAAWRAALAAEIIAPAAWGLGGRLRAAAALPVRTELLAWLAAALAAFLLLELPGRRLGRAAVRKEEEQAWKS
jgi:NitT/TauT family transport system permease protein